MKTIKFNVVAVVHETDRTLLLENDDFTYYAIATSQEGKNIKVGDMIECEPATPWCGWFKKNVK